MPPKPRRVTPDEAPPPEGFEIVPVSSLENIHLKVGIYGPNRVGKTTLACTFPKPLLLAAFELNPTGGALSVRRVPGVDYVKLTSSGAAIRLADYLGRNPKYRTVVVDSATAFQDIILKEILGLTSLPEQLDFGGVDTGDYRRRAELIKEGLRPFLNLPCHTVVVCKERDHNPPKDERVNPRTGKLQPDLRPRFVRGMSLESYVSFDLGGAAAGWLYDQVDYCCRLYLDKEVKIRRIDRTLNKVVTTEEVEEETGRYVRRLRIAPHPNFASGFRAEVHENLPESIEEPTYEKILAAIRAGEGDTEK